MQVVKVAANKWNQTALLEWLLRLFVCVIFVVSFVQLQISVSERTQALEKLQSIKISVEQQLKDLSDAKV